MRIRGFSILTLAAIAGLASGCKDLTVEVRTQKYRNHPMIQSLAKQAPELVTETYFKILPERLGIAAPANPPHLTLRFVDLPLDYSTTGIYRAETSSGPTIEFVNELLAGGRTNFRETLVHEMIHAMVLERLGYFRYFWRTPKWIREGMAAYGARQTDEYLRLAVLGEIDAGRYDASKPFDPKAFFKDVYTESSLRFEYLDKIRPDGFRVFARELWKQKNWKKALESASGMDVEQFESRASAHAAERIEDAVSGMPLSALHALELARKGKVQEALPALNAELPQALQDKRLEAGLLLFEKASALKKSGSDQQAIRVFEQLLRDFRPSHYANAGDVAIFDLAGALAHADRLEEAAELYLAVTRDYFFSGNLASSAWIQLGTTYNSLGRFKDAVAALDHTKPNGAWSDVILFMEKAKAYQGVGEFKKARRQAQKAVEKAPAGSYLQKNAQELLASIPSA